MAARIEDYALIGDTETAALVSRQGAIDWFCAPRFDAAACLAGLLGTDDHGSWSVAPTEEPITVERHYRGNSLVLETVFTTASGQVAVIDFMPVRGMVVPLLPHLPDVLVAEDAGEGPAEQRSRALHTPSIVRVVEGRAGDVEMRVTGRVRMDYGCIVPWVRAHGKGFSAVAGADGVVVHSEVDLHGFQLHHEATFRVTAGERVRFSMTWFPAHSQAPDPFDIDASLRVTEAWWHNWAAACTFAGPWQEAIERSLVTLKGLTYAPTGGIVAAPTTSLPEWIGSVRNWDYRYCWLRDATFTLKALLDAGFGDEAAAWSEWLRRSVAGSPDLMQIMYGVGGERRLVESEIDSLPGYEGSAPVRIGNAASGQFQLDVYGEVMDMFLTAELYQIEHVTHLGERGAGLPDDSVDVARFLVDHVRRVWQDPDDGIWEVRGPRRHFVHSKVMAWVAVDRWVQIIERCELTDDPNPWRELRDEIHADVCLHGFDEDLGSFTQYYGSRRLDASLLILGLVGFLPADDPRLIGTIGAVEATLLRDGFVLRYETDVAADVGATGDGARGAGTRAGDAATVDGLPPGEGAFLLTTFWLVDSLVLIGRVDDARELFERLVALRNDVGLLSEEYDPAAGRMLGNFPQAFSHIGLLNSAFNLRRAGV
jgi:GH15 family glucan-1,4-alpha-glucosidase